MGGANVMNRNGRDTQGDHGAKNRTELLARHREEVFVDGQTEIGHSACPPCQPSTYYIRSTLHLIEVVAGRDQQGFIGPQIGDALQPLFQSAAVPAEPTVGSIDSSAALSIQFM